MTEITVISIFVMEDIDMIMIEAYLLIQYMPGINHRFRDDRIDHHYHHPTENNNSISKISDFIFHCSRSRKSY